MKKKVLSCAMVLLLASGPAWPRCGLGVAGSASRSFSLGMEMEELLALFGEPKSCWAPEPARYYEWGPACSAARGVWPVVALVYYRKTATNEYELRFFLSADARASRLHPTIRVGGVNLLVDHPKPFAEIAGDIPELSKLCGPGRCQLLGRVFGGRPQVVAYLREQTDAEAELASLVATDWDGSVATHRWRLAAAFSLEGRVGADEPAWSQAPVEEVDFGVGDPESDKADAERDEKLYRLLSPGARPAFQRGFAVDLGPLR